jgi:hypothetical protein
MTVEKKVNYPPEMVKTMLEVYGAVGTEPEQQDDRQAAMEQLAETFGKTVASIRAKLSSESVYIPKVKAEKSTTKRILKSDLVDKIAENAGKENAEFFESLAGANKDVLNYILAMQGSADFGDLVQGEEAEAG